MKRIIPLYFLIFICCYFGNAQTNSIDIGSQNQNINATTTFNNWIVIATGPDVQTALCFDDGTGKGNTSAPPAVTPTGTLLPALNPTSTSNAYVVTTFPGWTTGLTYLSCFNGNTIYTPTNTVSDGFLNGAPYNISAATMTIRRKFFVCSNKYENVNFSLNVTVDNYLNNVIVDADSANPAILYNTGAFDMPSIGPINGTQSLSPGIHTIDIKCADGDWLNPNDGNGGNWYSFPTGSYLWNPFGLAITGSITSASNVLVNTNTIAAITGNNNMCAKSTSTLSNTTPGGVWSSSNTTIATVNQNGVVTGIAPGNTTISYTIGQNSCTNTATLNVAVTDCTPKTCSIVNSLIINTGYNPSTQSALTIGQRDSNWVVTSMSPAMQSDPLNICNPAPMPSMTILNTDLVNLPAAPPNSQYISCLNDRVHFTTVPLLYTMTVARYFTTYAPDNININMNISVDNSLNQLTIDGVPQPLNNLPFGSYGFVNYNFTKFLSAGTHSISMTVHDLTTMPLNFPDGAVIPNGFDLIVVGTVKSLTGINSLANNSICLCSPTSGKIDTTICQGQSYLGHSINGTYIDTLVNAAGCDSIRTLKLTVTNCTIPCNNWLYTPSLPSYVEVGQVNVAGNQLTVEAIANRNQPYLPGVGDYNDGDIVSKHQTPVNTNYLLRPNHAYITTTNGFFATPDAPCSIDSNKTYHLAMVYDGTTLKYYRDGFMMASVPATGNLYQNTFPTRIGVYTGAIIENFLGYTNEVRIWNVARTQAQIRANMNSSLPNPATQPGLLAYYRFDDLLNKQGNAAFNGTLNGAALINATNPKCTFVPDSCCAPIYTTIDTTICQGQTYLGHSITGTYIDTLTSTEGCDSIRTLNLTIGNCCSVSNCPLVNNLIINTGYDPVTQTHIATGKKDAGWVVTAMSDQMQGALCYSTTTSSQGPPANSVAVPPVLLNHSADVVDGTSGAISCFPFNTIYTVKPPVPPASGVFDYTMNIRKAFYICSSNTTESVTFSFTTICDDAVDSIIVDKGTPNAIQLLIGLTKTVGAGSPLNITKTVSLAPGPHTLDIKCADWQDPINGFYYPITVNGVQADYQWNPFVVEVTGTITSINNILVNSICCIATKSTIDTTICQGQTYLGHNTTGTFIDTLVNAGGCDSLRTLHLIVNNCGLSCNNWLQLKQWRDGITIGDLDVSGSQITVEAMFNSDTLSGDLVSKHYYPGNVNYLLRLTQAQVNTSNGLYTVNTDCPLQKHKTYHVAMVYDGTALKYYRDGYLLAQIPATGNLFDGNDYPATIGNHAVIYDPNYSYTDTALLDEVFRGYINEVRIWNVARTQNQIKTYMNSSLPNPTTQAGLLAYYTFDNLVNKQGNSTYNGVFQGSASAINRTNPNCTFTADTCCNPTTVTIDTTICHGQTYLGRASTGTYIDTLINIAGCDSIRTLNLTVLDRPSVDFTFDQDICSPKKVSFSGNITSTYTNYNWFFGNGSINNSTLNPTVTYPNLGTYTVQLNAVNSFGCADSVIKKIAVTVIPANIIQTHDTTICYGYTKQLLTDSTLNFCWSPTTYLNDPSLPNPVTSTTGKITYYFTAKVTGKNLIVNGDFNNGNTGFTSKYNYANPNLGEGQYFVGTDPHAWNPGMSSSCADHTGSAGNGNEMLVNGAAVSNAVVWSETIPVLPNTNYAFSAWAQNLAPSIYVNSSLQFSINGILIGNVFNTNLNMCTWGQFYSTWNSGNTTTAIISIVNNTLILSGNDFALDDISFAPVYIEQDSVIINVDTPSIKTSNDTTICQGNPVQLNTSGASVYSWSPAAGLSNPTTGNPVALPFDSTQYIVSGTTIHGCIAKDTVNIAVNARPVITKANDTSICRNTSVQLFASGGTSYQWSPAVYINNPNSPASIASPPTIPASTTYYVTVTGANTCSSNDSIVVSIRPLPNFTVSPNQPVCTTDPVQLNASGGNIYLWSPASLVSNPSIANPFTNTGQTATYSVQITESTCNNSAILTTTVTRYPPLIVSATKSNDLDCSNGSAKLTASGAAWYRWSPAIGLSGTTIANPIASLLTTQKYIVTGSNADGCIAYDTITVYANYADNAAGYYMPNAFTPNGDGINDCYGIRYWGLIEKLEFMIYDRWGNKVFYTNSPSACWDGTYKGVPATAGAYIYYIHAITACGPVERKGNLILVR